MQYIVNANQAKQIDQYTINEIKIPSLVLMERAALSVVKHMLETVQRSDKILVVCGMGNNGGDGVAIARLLHEKGYYVHVLLIGDRDKATEDLKKQLEIARNLEVDMNSNRNINEYTIVVDAIFGIGLTKSITGIYEQVINDINLAENKVFSVDIPSGVHADDGKIMNVSVKADITITFGYQKLGLLFYPGCDYAGKVFIEDIGFSNKALELVNPKTFIYEKSDLSELPIRKNDTNKGSFGRVLVIAGSNNMSGAAYLSASAAYRTGAGLVKVLTVEENRTILQSILPEAILSTYDSDYQKIKIDSNRILEDVKWASVIVIGPGIGVSLTTEYILDLVLTNATVPIIIDADAINILSKKKHNTNDLNESEVKEIKLPSNVILTPHMKEMAGFCNMSVKEMKDHLLNIALYEANHNKCILVLKDAKSIVTDGDHIYINTSGNNSMAKAGSGDVLTGIIAGLIAQGLNQYSATTLGVYIHGLAGDYYINNNSKYSLVARDLIESISKVLA